MHPLVELVAAITLFALTFRIAQLLSSRYVPVYADFSVKERGDWCSRINSTLHAAVIVPAMLYVLHLQDWDDDFMPLQSDELSKKWFAFSCGYFLFDIWVIVQYQVPLWHAFVVHHVVAALPYLIYNFYPSCGMDLYLLMLFLMVEFAVLPLNIATFLEQLGFGHSQLHAFFFYTTYVSWFAARVVLPLYNVYVLWRYVLLQPGLALAAPMCTLPSALCAHAIASFCVGVFVFVWTPDLLAKWRKPVVHLEEYQEYTLSLRQSLTPRSSPLIGSRTRESYGSTSMETPLLKSHEV